MASVVRRAIPTDVDDIVGLFAARPLDVGSDGHNGGIRLPPSSERIEEAVADDIVIVAECDGRVLVCAVVKTAETMRRTGSPLEGQAFELPDLGDRDIGDLHVGWFEWLVSSPELGGDRRPVIAVAVEALLAGFAEHEYLVGAALEAPVRNHPSHRLFVSAGFTEMGTVVTPVDDIVLRATAYAQARQRFEETISAAEIDEIIRKVVGRHRCDLPPFRCRPSAWRGHLLADQPERWTHQLSDDELDELVEAARSISDPEQLIGLQASEVPLPRLSATIDTVRTQLLNGLGFVLVRGLPVAELTPLERAAAFMILGVHLGVPRTQNADGHLLGHVRNVGLDTSDTNVRIYQTSARQTFHTDSCDVVGLCCVNVAREGGDSLLVSAETIFNEMRVRRPDLLVRLFEPVATDRRGEIPPGQKPYFEIPPLTWHEGHLSVLYQRQYIDSAQRFDDVEPLDDQLVEALDLFDELANDPDLNLPMTLTPGDMQFVNNHALLHDRTSFIDHDDPLRRRHLLRLWLAMPGDRPLPDVYAERYGSVTVGDRGGIVVEGGQPTITVD